MKIPLWFGATGQLFIMGLLALMFGLILVLGMASIKRLTMAVGEKNLASAVVGVSEHIFISNPGKKYPPDIGGSPFNFDMPVENRLGGGGIRFVNVWGDLKNAISWKICFRILDNFTYENVLSERFFSTHPPFNLSYKSRSSPIVVEHHSPWAYEIVRFIRHLNLRFVSPKNLLKKTFGFWSPEWRTKDYVSTFMRFNRVFLLLCHALERNCGPSKNIGISGYNDSSERRDYVRVSNPSPQISKGSEENFYEDGIKGFAFVLWCVFVGMLAGQHVVDIKNDGKIRDENNKQDE